MSRSAINPSYSELINQFPLVEIANDSVHRQALAVVNKYIGNKELTTGQIAYLKVLTTLIDQYEEERYPISAMSAREIIKSLMDFNNLKQADLIPYFGSRSQVNDFLVGRRELSKDQIRRLAKAFSISTDSLLAESGPVIKPKRRTRAG